MMFDGQQHLHWLNLQSLVSEIVRWQRHGSLGFAAVLQDAITAAIPGLIELLRDQSWFVRRAAASSLAEFAKHGE
jgi:HEAT repeat protein